MPAPAVALPHTPMGALIQGRPPTRFLPALVTTKVPNTLSSQPYPYGVHLHAWPMKCVVSLYWLFRVRT